MIKPILFNGQMVRAILEGRKTETRRICKDASDYCEPVNSFIDNGSRTYAVQNYGDKSHTDPVSLCEVSMPICVGDILWVRETFNSDWCDHTIYRADGGSAKAAGYAKEPRWHPSLHMPKSAARIFLKVTGVRVERLQDITEPDIRREGISDDLANNLFNEWAKKTDINITFAIQEKKLDYAWRHLWKKTGGDWNSNPWVWVYEFERCEKPEDF